MFMARFTSVVINLVRASVVHTLTPLLQRSATTMACTKLDKTSAKDLVNSVDNFLFDCDGVLWDGKGAIDGSLETIQKLLSMGKRVFYVTNNSTNTRDNYVKKCHKFGYPAQTEEIACTAYIAALYLHNIKFKGKVYVVGNPSMGVELDKLNIKHFGIGPDTFDTSEITSMLQMKLDDEVTCVLVGYDMYLNVAKISKAASYLQNPDVLFLATNEDSHLPVAGSKIVVPGTGTMVNAVKIPARRDPIILGKPEKPMFEVLRETHNLNPSRCCLVGDRINTDIGLVKR
ncbi:glycerol-3-phosphate phosphatase-like isoform X2 [Gigantopelta aegis]|uniref:glycerol-3-phosphate phosphatase-like isoform X2 n=1 Tax=Gigantopelta aegis TaxID=1735272 RepID=UPI001B889391|nr:glycerol-3-phosphate phosphatase-like isoform X2 [Gigantopelta aegis]